LGTKDSAKSLKNGPSGDNGNCALIIFLGVKSLISKSKVYFLIGQLLVGMIVVLGNEFWSQRIQLNPLKMAHLATMEIVLSLYITVLLAGLLGIKSVSPEKYIF
jgi:hypothetical protein